LRLRDSTSSTDLQGVIDIFGKCVVLIFHHLPKSTWLRTGKKWI
jgi:hypothetical protein